MKNCSLLIPFISLAFSIGFPLEAQTLLLAGGDSGGLNFTTASDPATGIFINEVDADTPVSDTAEFIELYDGGVGNTNLSGLVVVFFNGNGDAAYAAFDLDGYSTDANGFFVLGNAAVAEATLNFADNSLQNGADAVALYLSDATDFPNGTPVTDINLLDALVYGTSDSADSGLLDVLTPGQPQSNETADLSHSRSPDGGTQRVTASYVAQQPTPGASNGGTADTTGPAVINMEPANTSTTVFPHENLIIVFDKNIASSAGNITLHLASDDSIVESFNVATDVLIDGPALQINPTTDLTQGTGYYVQIPDGTIKDLLGNNFSGISGSSTWAFTVLAGTIFSKAGENTVSIGINVPDGLNPYSIQEFYAQNAAGNFDEYSLTEFALSLSDFDGAMVTDLGAASLSLTVSDRNFSTAGSYEIFFTTNTEDDLTGQVAYDALFFDQTLANTNFGIDQAQFSNVPVSVGSGTYHFDGENGEGFVQTIPLDLSAVETALIEAINSGEKFHLILAVSDTSGATVTYSGVGNSFDVGEPTLNLLATTGISPAAVLVNESGGATAIAEGGAADNYTIALNTQPTDDVTITVTADSQLDLGAGAGTAIILTFTNADWDQPQTVTVNAVDDTARESALHLGSITHSVSSNDSDYQGIALSNISVYITDNDFGPSNAVINEFVVDNSLPADAGAFIEILGSPNTDYSSLYLLEIEGDNNSATGKIDSVFQIGTTDENGFWVITDTDDSNANMENGTITIMLVQGFTGSVNDDIDLNNDGTIDNAPWANIIDGVAIFEGGSDFTYGDDPAVVVLTPDFDGGNSQVGGASRIPNGTDTDSDTDWVRNDFDGFGLGGGATSGIDGQAISTPSLDNQIFADTSSPTIINLLPADDISSVAVNSDLLVTFDENVQAGTGVITLHLASDDRVIESFDVASNVTFNGAAVMFAPTADLLGGTTYYVQIAPGAIIDTAATPNVFSGITDRISWNFTTIQPGIINEENFSSTPAWVNRSVAGTQPWSYISETATMSGSNNENHYLISPPLNFETVAGNVTISFDYEGATLSGSPEILLNLVYSTDYNGTDTDPEASATWTPIPSSLVLGNGRFDLANLAQSNTITLPDTLAGETTLYLAFRYNDISSAASEAWAIDNIVVAEATPTSPLGDYLALRGLSEADLEIDTDGNGLTVLEEYFFGIGDGLGADGKLLGVLAGGSALTVVSDLASDPAGVDVELLATSDLAAGFTPVDFTVSSEANGAGSFTRSYTENSPPAEADSRFYQLRLTVTP